MRSDSITGWVRQHVVERDLEDVSVVDDRLRSTAFEPATYADSPFDAHDYSTVILVDPRRPDNRDGVVQARARIHINELVEKWKRDRSARHLHSSEALRGTLIGAGAITPSGSCRSPHPAAARTVRSGLSAIHAVVLM